MQLIYHYYCKFNHTTTAVSKSEKEQNADEGWCHLVELGLGLGIALELSADFKHGGCWCE